MVCAHNPWASPHPYPSLALHGSGPIPQALRCHVNRAVLVCVCACVSVCVCEPACAHHCLGNPHIWFTRDRAIPRRHNWEGLEDSGGSGVCELSGEHRVNPLAPELGVSG